MPEHVAQRPVHQQLAERVAQPVAGRDRPAVEDLGAAAARDVHEAVEDPALRAARVLHADHHLGEQVLEHARRREVVGGADLAQVGHHRVARFGTVDREAGVHPLREREQVVAHPRHRQVREDAVVGTELVEAAAPGRGGDERVVRLPHALRLARGAGRVEHDRDVVGAALGHLGVEEAGVRAVEFAADLLQALEARHALVVAHAARIVVVDVRERRHLRLRLEHLVDLLLVLDDGEVDLGVVQHEHELGRGRVLVHRHRHAAEALRGEHRPVEARPVVADDREVHAAAEPLRRQAAGERAHFVGHLAPRPGLPDAKVLLPRRGMIGPHPRVLEHEPRERVVVPCHLLLRRAGRMPRARHEPPPGTPATARPPGYPNRRLFGDGRSGATVRIRRRIRREPAATIQPMLPNSHACIVFPTDVGRPA